jgi:hypothetical protein
VVCKKKGFEKKTPLEEEVWIDDVVYFVYGIEAWGVLIFVQHQRGKWKIKDPPK